MGCLWVFTDWLMDGGTVTRSWMMLRETGVSWVVAWWAGTYLKHTTKDIRINFKKNNENFPKRFPKLWKRASFDNQNVHGSDCQMKARFAIFKQEFINILKQTEYGLHWKDRFFPWSRQPPITFGSSKKLGLFALHSTSKTVPAPGNKTKSLSKFVTKHP